MSVAGSHDRGIWHHSGPGDSLCEAIVGKQSDFWILHYPYFVNLMMSMAIKDFTAWFFFVESPAFECFQVFCLLREGESLEQMINVLVRITVNFKRHYYLIFCWNHALQGSDFEGLEAQGFLVSILMTSAECHSTCVVLCNSLGVPCRDMKGRLYLSHRNNTT